MLTFAIDARGQVRYHGGEVSFGIRFGTASGSAFARAPTTKQTVDRISSWKACFSCAPALPRNSQNKQPRGLTA